MKTDNIVLAEVFENFILVSIREYGINPLYSVSACSFTLQCGLKKIDSNYKHFKIRIWFC